MMIRKVRLIVAFEVFDILQHKNRWLTSRDNSHHVKNSVPRVSQAKPCARPIAFS